MPHDKRLQAAYADFDRAKSYPLPDAVRLIKQNAKAKFDETIEMSMNSSASTPVTRTRWSVV